MKTVLTVGVFDLLHWGHFELLRRAKDIADGGKLIVAVQEDDVVHQYKPDVDVAYDLDKRLKMVAALRYVDKVVPYRHVQDIVKRIAFTTFVVGEEQNHGGFQSAISWCKGEGRDVIVLARTKGISSSQIRAGKCGVALENI